MRVPGLQGRGCKGRAARVGGGVVIVDQGELFTAPNAPDAPLPPHSKCDECTRLFEQGRAAVIVRDRSRLVDARILQARHNDRAHASDASP